MIGFISSLNFQTKVFSWNLQNYPIYLPSLLLPMWSYSVCVARSGEMAHLLGARVPTGGKQAMVAKPVGGDVNYLAHLRDFYPLVIWVYVGASISLPERESMLRSQVQPPPQMRRR